MKVKFAQLCRTLCNPMSCTVHEILQARILEQVAVLFFRGSFRPRDRTGVSRIAGGFFTAEPLGKPRYEEGRLIKINNNNEEESTL